MFTLINSSRDVAQRFLIECGMIGSSAAATIIKARASGFERVTYGYATFTIHYDDGEFTVTIDPYNPMRPGLRVN